VHDAPIGGLVGLFPEIDGHFGTVSRSLGLTPQQARLLCFTQNLRPSFGELAALLHCVKTNVTGLVDRLQRRGRLTRRPDPHDRRMTRVHLTGEGEALTEEFQQAINAALTAPLASWSGARRESLAELLRGAACAIRP
jgi:DNA-binding MarR family transcriptional regulator